MLAAKQFEDVLQFWFPNPSSHHPATMVRQWEWWFRGGANAEVSKHFSPILEQAIRGELDTWANAPRSRLALILILDQFSRSIYSGTAQSFDQDAKACSLAIEGIEMGHYTALQTPYEKTFFILPLGHSEDLRNLEQAISLAAELVEEVSQEYRDLFEFSAAQARRHRDIIATFGRHPHRNEVLGRQSTPQELDYLASGQLVHLHPMPAHLIQSLS